MDPKTTLAKLVSWTTGKIESELLLKIEYLHAENQILKRQLHGKPKLTREDRKTLAKIGKQLGRTALAEVTTIVTPDTILMWYRKLIAKKFDGSKKRKKPAKPGRPTTERQIEKLVIKLATENNTWGYQKIVGALKALDHKISHQTVANILEKHGIQPAPERKKKTSWTKFIRAHIDQIVATDFFTVEALTMKGLVTFYVLFFIHLGSRRVHIAGLTPNPDDAWMCRIARNETMEETGFLKQVNCRYFIHDRDGKFTENFDRILNQALRKDDNESKARKHDPVIILPPCSPNLNPFAERWVRSAKEECFERMILFGESGVRWAAQEFVEYYHQERPHQGKDNRILFPLLPQDQTPGRGVHVRRKSRLGGLLNFYYRRAS